MMKRALLLATALVTGLTAMAQDLIVKIDSTRIEARVAEISTETIRYKRFARPDGPTYVLLTAEVCYIRYSDGFIESYNRTAAPAVAQAAAPAPQPAPAAQPTPAPTPQPTPAAQPAPAPAPQQTYYAPVQYEITRYSIGQYYDQNGIRGIVVALNEERTHGLLMSLDEVMIEWSTFRKEELCKVGAEDRTNGENNMKAIERYIAEHNLTWDHFPAFKWCKEKGEGWYLPSIDEVLTIGNQYNGGSRAHNDRQSRMRFNDNLKVNGGERIDGKCYYHSSTEFDEKFPMMSHMGLEPPFVITDVAKYTKFLVRAVRKF
ncbi:MAG: hypothetical protein IJ028_00230 [Alistipes sp.]|nr:hypothetical protein [Alistipes sp.]